MGEEGADERVVVVEMVEEVAGQYILICTDNYNNFSTPTGKHVYVGCKLHCVCVCVQISFCVCVYTP